MIKSFISVFKVEEIILTITFMLLLVLFVEQNWTISSDIAPAFIAEENALLDGKLDHHLLINTTFDLNALKASKSC